MEDNSFDDSDKSEFNFGIATLQRIHNIKQELDIITLYPDPVKHFKLLKAFYKEIRPMLKEEKKEHDNKLAWCKTQYSSYIKQKSSNTRKITADIASFDTWEHELRDLDQFYGLNLPKKKDPRWAASG